MESKRIRVVVEIDPGDPVSGSAARDGEPQIRFEGMLGFLSLFDRLRSGADLPAAEGQEDGG